MAKNGKKTKIVPVDQSKNTNMHKRKINYTRKQMKRLYSRVKGFTNVTHISGVARERVVNVEPPSP